MKSVAIIGGGFSGAITAVNLARLSPHPLEIFIIDKNQDPCRGIAYSTRNGSHLLNVVARNMSALADQPNHFVEWLRTRADYLDTPVAAIRETFMPRKVYGEYIHSLFLWYSALLTEEKEMRFEQVQDEAQDIAIEGASATVCLASGRKIKADKIVLAVGNQAPSAFRMKGLDAQSPKYIGDPWLGWEKKLPSKDKDILIIGTGLTTVDTILTLKDLCWQGKIYAVSRNGLMPLSHFRGVEYPDYATDELASKSFREIFGIFKKHYRAAKSKNINTAILVDKLRPFTQRIWQHFSLEEKKRFNRHFRTKWNVMRHRIAPEIHQQLQDAIAQNKLEVIKARLRGCEETKDAVRVTLESNGVARVIEVGSMINCTGPKETYAPAEVGLFHNLSTRGVVQPDAMNMGVNVAPNFAVIGNDGVPSEIIYAMGSIMKGTLWETIAVPELRSQAFRLAETIAGQLADKAPVSPISEVVENVMEYSI
jgi:uncharacterized NAD(P)/FAD-binding protein YdhS